MAILNWNIISQYYGLCILSNNCSFGEQNFYFKNIFNPASLLNSSSVKFVKMYLFFGDFHFMNKEMP